MLRSLRARERRVRQGLRAEKRGRPRPWGPGEVPAWHCPAGAAGPPRYRPTAHPPPLRRAPALPFLPRPAGDLLRGGGSGGRAWPGTGLLLRELRDRVGRPKLKTYTEEEEKKIIKRSKRSGEKKKKVREVRKQRKVGRQNRNRRGTRCGDGAPRRAVPPAAAAPAAPAAAAGLPPPAGHSPARPRRRLPAPQKGKHRPRCPPASGSLLPGVRCRVPAPAGLLPSGALTGGGGVRGPRSVPSARRARCAELGRQALGGGTAASRDCAAGCWEAELPWVLTEERDGGQGARGEGSSVGSFACAE